MTRKNPSTTPQKGSLSLEEETKLMEDKLMALRIQMAEERKKREERKRENGLFWDSGRREGGLKVRAASASSRSFPPESVYSSSSSNSSSSSIYSSSSSSGSDSETAAPGDKIMYARKNKDLWENPFAVASTKSDTGLGVFFFFFLNFFMVN
jgi:hypothetical protein